MNLANEFLEFVLWPKILHNRNTTNATLLQNKSRNVILKTPKSTSSICMDIVSFSNIECFFLLYNLRAQKGEKKKANWLCETPSRSFCTNFFLNEWPHQDLKFSEKNFLRRCLPNQMETSGWLTDRTYWKNLLFFTGLFHYIKTAGPPIKWQYGIRYVQTDYHIFVNVVLRYQLSF